MLPKCANKKKKEKKENKRKKPLHSQRSYILQSISIPSLARELFLAQPAECLITCSREAVHASTFSLCVFGCSVAGYLNP